MIRLIDLKDNDNEQMECIATFDTVEEVAKVLEASKIEAEEIVAKKIIISKRYVFYSDSEQYSNNDNAKESLERKKELVPKILFLINEKGYPRSKICQETGISVGVIKKYIADEDYIMKDDTEKRLIKYLKRECA